MIIMQSYPFSHMPQISASNSQALHCFWAWESMIRFFLQQKGKTVENEELTAVVNLLKKKKGKRGKSCWKKFRQNEAKKDRKDMYQL